VSDPAGIERQAVEAWLLAHVEGLRPPFTFSRIHGGRSNLTYVVDDGAGRSVILRRPPLGDRLATAHDMGREFRILDGLHGTVVPVPRPLGFCPDEAVTGAPFYVMDHVDGAVLRNAALALDLSVTESERIADSLVDTLATLHEIDPDAVGLGELGRREGYLERQLRRWHQQSRDAAPEALARIDEVHAFLVAHMPEQAGVAITHGDYRLENVIVSPEGSVAAVLDWELCTLGDPMADLGLLLAYWREAGEGSTDLEVAPATTLEGFPNRHGVAARYAERTGRSLDQVHYYQAFGFWKLSCIAVGVVHRFAAGSMGDSTVAEESEDPVTMLIEKAERAVGAYRDGEPTVP
jgi:aminoglycoside phosphotransferase (APT) family kinase protein